MSPASFESRSDCPACGALGRPAFSRSYGDPTLRAALVAFYSEVGGLDYSWLEGARYSVSNCPECSTWFQSSIPAEAMLGKLYEEWIDPDKARLRFHDELAAHVHLARAREVQIAFSLSSAGAPRVALDYGCGWGEWGRMIQAFGHEAWGTELSQTRREYALGHGIRAVSEAELPDGHFGQINLDQVLEHLPDPGTCLRMLARKLHPAGSLRMAVPHAARVSRALRNFDRELTRPRLGALNAIAPLEHLNAFTTTRLLQLASSCGLARIKPQWFALFRSLVFPPGIRGKLVTFIRPFYLRSSYTTHLFFRRRPGPVARRREATLRPLPD